MTNLFLTGPKHIGKTTLWYRVFHRSGSTPGGYVVKRVVKDGRVVRFDLCDLATRRRAPIVYPSTLGTWDTVHSSFDTLGVASVLGAISRGSIIMMDELGDRESGSGPFARAVRLALSSPVPACGVIKMASTPFLDEIRQRPDVEVVTLTESNRSQVESHVEHWLLCTRKVLK
ncbi:MAG: nucleoside-triphosphatase [Bacillota bacterium]